MLLDLPCVEILGVPIARLEPDEALAAIEEATEKDPPALVAYANAHTLNLAWTDADYRKLLQKNAAIVLNDGAGVAIAARVQRRSFPANLNGSDFNPRILELAARRGWPVYFLGARPGVAQRAAERLAGDITGLEVVGARDGYFSLDEEQQVAADVKESGAQVLMTAMGNPLQEWWLARNLSATGAGLGVGVGAFFDFAAGEVPRAPSWMNRFGIEWLHRLVLDPRRLWRRYVLGNPLFLLRVVRERVRGRGA
ncbi:MAG TPA: WecB/TagA/CpsF family glycosyltransferase [Actinomycetota bacterium]|nr:WecB/TagA/CpsF family glycosyltransferase [Actinomycetota bacterium]